MWTFLLACVAPDPAGPGDTSHDTSPGDSAAGDTAPVDEGVTLEPPELGVQLGIGPLEVPPGEERYLCKTMRLPNDAPLDVIALEHAASGSAHHFNIWGLLAGPEDTEGDCDEVWSQTSMQLASPLYGSQDPTFYGAFPDGVAASLPADQLVLLELHVINATTEPLSAEALFNAYAAAPGTIDTYANGIFGSIDDIYVPPHGEATVSADCRIDRDVEVFVLGSHFHSHGRLFEIRLLDAQGEPGEVVYQNTDPDSPELSIFSDDPIHIPAGSGFHYSCTYENPTDVPIEEGEGADDEMCMMAAVYYPDQGFLWCQD